jgi:hypothetical protein
MLLFLQHQGRNHENLIASLRRHPPVIGCHVRRRNHHVGPLNTTIPGFFFSQAVFNLDATANGSASITAFDQFGTSFLFSLPLSGAGQNFFTLTTAGGKLISRVAFTTTVGLDDVSQIRFGEIVPIPGSIVGAGLPGLLAACGGLLLLARRRRKLVVA